MINNGAIVKKKKTSFADKEKEIKWIAIDIEHGTSQNEVYQQKW